MNNPLRAPRRLVAGLLSLALAGACATSEAPGPAAEPVVRAPDPQPFDLPYAEVEAEAFATTGTIPPASTVLFTPGAEASGRQFVRLAPGQSVTIPAPAAADSLVVRYSWPDEVPDGVLEARMGEGPGAPVVRLPLTSRYVWEYGRPAWGTGNVWNNDPGSGSQRHFWDEASARTPAFAAGTPVVLTNPPSSKHPVLVDLVDFEAVPPAVPCPEGAVNFADFQPDATGAADLTALLQKAADRAKGGVLYLPEGTYRTDAVYLGAVTVQGAGLWRTRLVGPLSQLRFEGKTAAVRDLALWGETSLRNDNSDEDNGFAGAPGPGTMIERVWVEHKKCAFWVGNWGSKTPVTGLVLRDCRFRDLMADGVNLCSGTNRSQVEGCLVRNSGDDALAAWSPKNGGPAGGDNTFRANLVQLPWVASGIALYGGGPFLVEGNVVKDTVTTGSGVYISSNFGAWPFAGLVLVKNNVLVRAGAHESDPSGTTGAIRLLAGDLAMETGTYELRDNTVVAPLESAVSVHGPRRLGRVLIDGLTVVDGGSAETIDVKRNADAEVETRNVSR